MENEIRRDALQIAHEDIRSCSYRPCHRTIRRESGCRYARRRPIQYYRALIRGFVDSRPTYGYLRIKALLNRRFSAASAPRVYHKQIFCIIKLHGLLLQSHTDRRIESAHDGTVRTLRPNMRWCSDGFAISYWNGEILRVAFTLGTCDLEAITLTASMVGVTGECYET